MLSLLSINRNIRSLKRYRDVIGILIKYGFGHVVEQLNIDYYLEVGRRIVTLGIAHKSVARFSAAERLRLAMIELGPTFVKLGQILSARPDVIPKEYVDELKKLQDRVPPVSLAEISDFVKEREGRDLKEIFEWIEPEPLAAASIAQVHRVRLHTGEDAVLKIQRPRIDKIIETDLDILEGLAYLVDRHLPAFDIYDPIGLVREFRRSIFRELDFTREGHTIERFERNFADNEQIHVPSVYWEQTCDIYLTLEYIDGVKISHTEELVEKGHDLKQLAEVGATAFLDQVLEYQLFHGDPHPGNVFVREDGTISLVDFGMVGRVDEALKRHLVDLLFSILDQDVERLVSHLFYAGSIPEGCNTQLLKRDLGEFIDNYYGYPLQDIRVGNMLHEFIEILAEHRISFPTDFIILAKALVIMEGVGRQLDPDFNMVDHLKPYMAKIARERLSPAGISKELGDVVGSYSSLIKSLPRDLKEIVNRINHNKFKIDLEHVGLDRLIDDIDKSSNRLSFSLIIASLIVGSSLIMQTDKGPFLFGFPLLGMLGYSIAAFLGLGLAIAIIRSGRM